jgi:hypothetical protein
MKYAALNGSGAMIYILSFLMIGSGIKKLMEGGFTDAQTTWRSHKTILGKHSNNIGTR